MQERPRFRSDLVANPVLEGGNRFVDVTDPDSGSTFRFYEVEYAVACAMDGQRDYEGLVAWSKSELGLEPSAGEIATVVGTLEELGYLAATAGDGDLALGNAGRSPLTQDRPPVVAGDVELGSAGVHEQPTVLDEEAPTRVDAERPAAAPAESGEDQSSEVSVDLGGHIASTIDEAPTEAETLVAGEDDDEGDEGTAVGSEPISIPDAAPSVKPPAPAAVDEPEAQVAESSGGGAATAVLIILLLGVLGVGGWWVYTNFIQTGGADTTEAPAE